MDTVILILVDGMRPDGLQQATTPVLDRLIAEGSWTLQAKTVFPSISLPCIASLILGTPPTVHGITTNTWTYASPTPGIMDVVKANGLRAASFFNWEPLRDLSRPGALHISLFLDNDEVPKGRGDMELVELTAELLRREPVDFAFIYLGHTDAAGHTHGWMSEPYLRAIENADACIGTILQALEDREVGVIVTADHGGHDTHHGSDSPEDMTIPIVLYQPNLTTHGEMQGPVSILDIAPTVIQWMGLTTPEEWQGRALGQS